MKASADRTLLGLETSTLTLSLAVVRLGGAREEFTSSRSRRRSKHEEERFSHEVRENQPGSPQAGPVDSFAPGAGPTVLARRDVPPGPNHSKLLPLLIEEVLREAGVELRALDGICVGLGPGAFTGLRIALATAKGLAWAARVPLAGASSLESMALAAARLVPDAAVVVPLLDARKQEVYAGFFRPTETGVEPCGDGPAEVVAPPAAVAERLRAMEGPILLLGEGYFAYRALFDEATAGLRHPHEGALPATPPAQEIAELAASRLGPWSKETIFSLEPHYVRASDAELFPSKPKKRL